MSQVNEFKSKSDGVVAPSWVLLTFMAFTSFVLIVFSSSSYAATKSCAGVCVVEAPGSVLDCVKALAGEDGYYDTQNLGAQSHVCNARHTEIEAVNNPNIVQGTGIAWKSTGPGENYSCYDPGLPFSTVCATGFQVTSQTCPTGEKLKGDLCVEADKAVSDKSQGKPAFCPVAPAAGNPIYLGSGNKLLTVTDYQGVGHTALR